MGGPTPALIYIILGMRVYASSGVIWGISVQVPKSIQSIACQLEHPARLGNVSLEY